MKRGYMLWGAIAAMAIGALALLIPGSPVYLPEVLAARPQFEGRTAGSWARDLDSSDKETRQQAIFALGAIGEPAGDAVPALAAILTDDPDEGIRGGASLALSKMGPAAKPAVPALGRALKDPQPVVRMNAARALLQLGKASEPVVPALIEALRDDSNEIFVDAFTATVREVVALALGRATAGSDVGVPALSEAIASARTDQTRRAAIRALGDVGPAAHAAIPVIREQQKSKNRFVREVAEKALQQIGATEPAAARPAAQDLARLGSDGWDGL